MTAERRRHTHPLVLVTVVFCAFASLAVQGRTLGVATRTADIARDVTDPNCDRSHLACRRSLEQRQGFALVFPDSNEISVIGSFCATQHDQLEDVRTCVEAEFRKRTGYPPSGGGTSPRISSTSTTLRSRP